MLIGAALRVYSEYIAPTAHNQLETELHFAPRHQEHTLPTDYIDLHDFKDAIPVWRAKSTRQIHRL